MLLGSYMWKNLGYDIVLWMAGLAGISGDIYEAARIDGAGEWTIFRRITLPCLLPTLFTVSVLSLLNSFKVFREAYLVAGDYPHRSMYLLQHLFNNWFVNLELDKMAAAAVCVGTVLFLFILLLQRFWDQDTVPHTQSFNCGAEPLLQLRNPILGWEGKRNGLDVVLNQCICSLRSKSRGPQSRKGRVACHELVYVLAAVIGRTVEHVA